jgi:hypothetical protein
MPYGQPSNLVDRFCQSIITKDPSIRFAGIANQMGKLIATAYRGGLQPLMSLQETEHYTVQTVLRASTRETFENKIGKQKYAIAVYEKLIRATVPITSIVKNANEQKEKKDAHQEEQDLKRLYLLISFNTNSDVISILEDKILPDIKQFEKGLFVD